MSISEVNPGLTVNTASGFAVNTASGTALTVDGYGDVLYQDPHAADLTTSDGQGIVAIARPVSGTGAASLTVETSGNVTSTKTGVSASNLGAGALSVKVGNVTTTNTTSDGFGVQISGTANGTGLSLETGSVNAGYDAINFGNYAGEGAVSITAGGDVISNNGYGIFGQATNGNTAVSIDVNGDVQGGARYGIGATIGGSNGTGTLDVDVSGVVTGYQMGIYASATGGTTLSLDVGGAVGQTMSGIRAYSGSGNSTITARGLVEGGELYSGVDFFNNGAGDDIISLTDVQGGKFGVNISGAGAGDITLDVTGDAKALQADGTGVSVLKSGGTGDLDISLNSASATLYGAYVSNSGLGATGLSATGDIRATTSTGTGLLVLQGTDAGSVNLDLASVYGGNYGIWLGNSGTGPTTIESTGTIEASSGYGLLVSGTQDVTIDANTVRGNSAALYFSSTGEADVTLRGDVSANGSTVYANGTSLIDLTLTDTATLGLTAGTHAGTAVNVRTGRLTLTNAGSITGGLISGSGDDDIVNAGDWTLADWTSGVTAVSAVHSGAGNDRFTNLANGHVQLALDETLAETASFAGLETFLNYGSLSMADGGATDLTRFAGNVTFQTGSNFAVDVDAAGRSDRVEVAGQAVIENGTKVTVSSPDGIKLNHDYLVLSATGGVTGAFSDVVSPFLGLESRSDATNTYVRLNQKAEFNSVAVSGNQQAVANAIPSSGEVHDALLLTTTDAEARDALDQLSGEIHASAQAAMISGSGQISGILEKRMLGQSGGETLSPAPLAYAPEESNGAAAFEPLLGMAADKRLIDLSAPTVWSSTYGQFSELEGNAGAADMTARSGGLVVGMDAVISDWRLGVMAGYGRSGFNTNDRNSEGTSDNYSIGLYAATNFGPFKFRSGLMHSLHKLETERVVDFSSLSNRLEADYDARSFEAFTEIGYGVNITDAVALEPFVGLSFTRLANDDYTETGGAARLSSNGSELNATFTTIGVRAVRPFVADMWTGSLIGGVSWKHGYGELASSTEHALSGGSDFTISGTELARDTGIIEAGVNLTVSHNTDLAIIYTGEFSSQASENGVKADLRVRF